MSREHVITIKQRRVDEKHSMFVDAGDKLPYLAKRLMNGELQPIPDNEPVILFRGRDKLALPC